jgi:hypothetical protein
MRLYGLFLRLADLLKNDIIYYCLGSLTISNVSLNLTQS